MKLALPSLLAVFFCAAATLLVPRSSSSMAPPPARGAERPSFCPFQTPEEWQRFLERYAGNEKWGETCEDSACDGKYFNFVLENIGNVLQACQGFIERNPGIARCTANLRRFVPAWLRQHDATSYGFDVDNRTYLDAQEAKDKPKGMMTPPAAIIAALPDRRRVEEAARKSGLKYLTHDSAIDGIRTFVLTSDPDGKFDQWLLLNLKDRHLQSGTPLSVLAVQKKDADGHVLPKVRLHFRDYTIVKERDRYRLALNYTNNGKCYSCHANGVRQLIARHTPVLEGKPVRGEAGFTENGEAAPTDFAYSRLMEFNRRLRSYGSPDWDGKIHPENFGPPIGKAQGCTDCHNGTSRGVLNLATSVTQLEKKVYSELSMPYDTELPRLVERYQMKNPALAPGEEALLRQAFEAHQDLTEELLKSRVPLLRDWLLETPCKL